MAIYLRLSITLGQPAFRGIEYEYGMLEVIGEEVVCCCPTCCPTCCPNLLDRLRRSTLPSVVGWKRIAELGNAKNPDPSVDALDPSFAFLFPSTLAARIPNACYCSVNRCLLYL
jgi:hypothetical protein